MLNSRGDNSSLRRSVIRIVLRFSIHRPHILFLTHAAISWSVLPFFLLGIVSILIAATVISPSEQKLPPRVNFEIVKVLQTVVAPNVFTPRGAYDGRKNLFSSAKFSFGNSAEVGLIIFVNISSYSFGRVASVFCLSCNSVVTGSSTDRREERSEGLQGMARLDPARYSANRLYLLQVKLTHVAQINPECG